MRHILLGAPTPAVMWRATAVIGMRGGGVMDFYSWRDGWRDA